MHDSTASSQSLSQFVVTLELDLESDLGPNLGSGLGPGLERELVAAPSGRLSLILGGQRNLSNYRLRRHRGSRFQHQTPAGPRKCRRSGNSGSSSPARSEAGQVGRHKLRSQLRHSRTCHQSADYATADRELALPAEARPARSRAWSYSMASNLHPCYRGAAGVA